MSEDGHRSSTAKLLTDLIRAVALALVIWFLVIPQFSEARSAFKTISSINPLFVALAAGSEVLAWVFYARMTQRLCPPEHRPSLPIAFGTGLASKSISHVVPGGSAITTAVNVKLLRRAGVPDRRLAFTLSGQAITSAVVLNGMLTVSLLLAIPATGIRGDYKVALALGLAMYVALGLALGALLHRTKPAAEAFAALLGRLPGLHRDAVYRYVTRLAGQVRELLADRRILVQLTIDATMNWLLGAAALGTTLVAFGGHPPVVGLLVSYCLANVMAVLPISPGGLGVVEAVLISTLGAFGVDHGVASVGVLTYRALSFWLPIPLGLLAYAYVMRATR
jgi:uncharacterized protein (TIRG00374 family)